MVNSPSRSMPAVWCSLCADGLATRYFAAEIIGNVMDVEPRRWMRPRKIDRRHYRDRIDEFKDKYDKYDWTGLIGK